MSTFKPYNMINEFRLRGMYGRKIAWFEFYAETRAYNFWLLHRNYNVAGNYDFGAPQYTRDKGSAGISKRQVPTIITNMGYGLPKKIILKSLIF